MDPSRVYCLLIPTYLPWCFVCRVHPPQLLSAARADLQLQHAIAASGLPHVPRMEVPSFAEELHGSFADLAAQLQECVDERDFGKSGQCGCSSE